MCHVVAGALVAAWRTSCGVKLKPDKIARRGGSGGRVSSGVLSRDMGSVAGGEHPKGYPWGGQWHPPPCTEHRFVQHRQLAWGQFCTSKGFGKP